jgi:CRISPR-associated protein Cmr6
MGNPHPVENGFSWHPTLAVPYLAGSAVKGLVRAWVEMNDDLEVDNKARLKHWFGTEDKELVAEQAGDFIFFDALPHQPPTLLCDIMTPHMGKWYEQGGEKDNLKPDVIPADWHEPVPVPFLAVKNAQFIFSIAARDLKHQAEVAKIFEALNQALIWLGAGAKTAAGYGYMSDITEDKPQAQTAEDENEPATMTESQKAISALEQGYQQAKANPKSQPVGGQLNNLLTDTIKKVGDWSDEDKQAL